MYTLFNLLSAATIFTLIPAVQGHMSMWHPSMYGFNKGSDPVNPLANKGFDQWWFHGFLNSKGNEVMSIRPGQDLKVEIACSKHYTSWGGGSSNDACPGDAGSYHAGGHTGSASGWNGNSESNLVGCALAIAFKSDAYSVRPEDFTIMSVQERCVRQRDTYFSIPANLPSCPGGECTCAWFWQGKNSADEMYMTGFRCRVEKGIVTNDFPKPVKPKRGNIKGATQPIYWANDNSNLDYRPDWNSKPSYNGAFGWKNGAQTEAFAGLTAGGNANLGNGNANTSSTTSTTSSSSSTTTSRTQGTPTTSAIGYNHAADAITTTTSSTSTSSTAAAIESPPPSPPVKGTCKKKVQRSRHRKSHH